MKNKHRENIAISSDDMYDINDVSRRATMRKKQIAAEAFKLFARQGYDSTTMKQIGDAVGLDKSSLYVHFKNKREIFEANLKYEIFSFEHDVLETIPGGDSLKEKVHCLFANILRYFNKDKILFFKQVMLMSASGSSNEVSAQSQGAITHVKKDIRELIDNSAGMKNETDRNGIFVFLLVITQGFLDWLLVQGNIDEAAMNTALGIFERLIGSNDIFN